MFRTSDKSINSPGPGKSIYMRGHSDSGKTTIAVWLIQKLTENHHKVAFLKNIPHDDLAIDVEGKDTDRAFKAGAIKIIGRTPTRTFSLERESKTLRTLMSGEGPETVYIVEGFHSETDAVAPGMEINILASGIKDDSMGRGHRAEVRISIPGEESRQFTWPEEKDEILKIVIKYLNG